MKYELLKRTAIALFVGSVISTYSVAEGSQLSENSSLKDVTNAINQNGANITKIKQNVSALAKSLKGDDQNPGLLDALEEANKGLNENKEALALKADKALVDELDEDLGNLEDKVSGIVDTAANKEDLGKLNDAVEELRDDVNNNTDILSQNSDDIAANKEAIEENKATVDAELAKKADKADVNKIKNNISALAKTLKGDDQNPGLLDALEEANKGLNENTKEIEKIKNLQGYDSLTKVEALVSGKADKALVDELDEDLGNLEDKVSGIADTAANKEDLVKLNDAVETLRDDVNNNTDILSQNSDDIAENKEAIEANKTELATKADKTELATKADKTELATKADKTELAAKADKTELAAKADKTELATKADKTELAAKADKTELAAKADKTELANKADKDSVYSKSETDDKFALKADNSVVSVQAADINNLRTDVNAHKVDINKLRTDVNTHTKRLDHLDNRVNKLDKDLKRGLAAQAALTGLFQPYTVGKANFTAAVGGYKSQTAVAVGTGYRYNQNIATKAGVAFTQGGGVTYNAGVNFEW